MNTFHSAFIDELEKLAKPRFNKERKKHEKERDKQIGNLTTAGVGAVASGSLAIPAMVEGKVSPNKSVMNKLKSVAERKGYTVHPNLGLNSGMNPKTKQIILGPGAGPAVMAHELGHISKNKLFTKLDMGSRRVGRYSMLGAAAPLAASALSKDPKTIETAGKVGALAALAPSAVPLASELRASAKGYKYMRRAGMSRRGAVGRTVAVLAPAFATYLGGASLPASLSYFGGKALAAHKRKTLATGKGKNKKGSK